MARARCAALALDPEIRRLRHRHAADPARLAREVRAAHRSAGVSPYAGLVPALAQVPLLLVVHRLCVVPVVAGVPDVVAGAHLVGAPLAERAWPVVVAAGAAPGPALAVVVLLALLAAVAWASSEQAVRHLRPAGGGEATRVRLVTARLAPVGVVAAAAVVPVAVGVHLPASTAWLLAEQAVLARPPA